MTFQNNDPNRPINPDPNFRRPASANTSAMSTWGIPAAVAAAVIIGLFLYNSMGDRNTTTATNNNNTAPVTSSTSPGKTPAPTPSQAPLSTAPKQ